MTVALQDPALLLGGLSGLDLLMTETDPATGARIHALGDNLSLGDPEVVIASIVSQLQDGDLERIDRFGNRGASIPLVIDAPDSDSPGDAIARMEAALDAACRFDGWTELVHISPLPGAAASVFEVTSATVSATFDDVAEMTSGCRYVTLSIHARPFVRTLDPVTIDAPAVAGSTMTSVDSGSSTTGWSLLSTAPAPVSNLIDPDSWTSGSANASAGGNSSSSTGASLSKTTTATGYGLSGLMTVTPGTDYRFYTEFSASFTSAITTWTVGFRARWLLADGTTVVAENNYQTSIATYGHGWNARAIVFTAPAGAVRLRVLPYLSGNTGSDVLSWRHFIVRPQAAVIPSGEYFDGSTADTTAVNYTWDGVASQSPSTATWTAPTLAVASGAVKGTVYGRSSAAIRRAGAVTMSALPYIRVKGTASAYSDGLITVADNGGGALTAASYSYNPTTGVFEILINRPVGFSAIDVTFARTGGTISSSAGLFVAVDQIDITDNPFATGKVQSRQVEIFGSQRTELSLSVLGLDSAGTTPVGLGEQVLVHTAAAGTDSGAKFLACRGASSVTPTGSDSAATSGSYNTLSTTTTPTGFTFPASALLTGSYYAVARVRSATVGSTDLSLRASITPTVGDPAFDPRTGWKTAPLTVVASGAVWPQVNQNAWVMVPLGMLRLPPADMEDAGATITVQMARGANAVDVDDIFLLNMDAGQTSLLITSLTSGSYSAVRLDAATVDAPQPSAWVGVANGTMLADAARWVGEQHSSAPGLLQVSTVTPGCATSRVSAHYYPRFHTHVVDVGDGS